MFCQANQYWNLMVYLFNTLSLSLSLSLSFLSLCLYWTILRLFQCTIKNLHSWTHVLYRTMYKNSCLIGLFHVSYPTLTANRAIIFIALYTDDVLQQWIYWSLQLSVLAWMDWIWLGEGEGERGCSHPPPQSSSPLSDPPPPPCLSQLSAPPPGPIPSSFILLSQPKVKT